MKMRPIWILFCVFFSVGFSSEPIIFQTSIKNEDGKHLGQLKIHRNEEPVDAIETFRVAKKLDRVFRDEIRVQICKLEHVKCTREKPAMFRTKIYQIDGAMLGEFVLLEGEEPADTVYRFAKRYQLSDKKKKKLLKSVCAKKSIACTRSKAVLFTQPIVGDEGKEIGILKIHENEEPVDAIQEFIVEHDLPISTRPQFLENICSKWPCYRSEPMAFSQEISDSGGKQLGTLQVMVGTEPADAVLEFGRRFGLSRNERKSIVEQICANNEKLKCKRLDPIVISSPVTLSSGYPASQRLIILEGEEVADAVYKFSKLQGNIGREFRWNIIEQLCIEGKVNADEQPVCTRGEALLHSQVISDENGTNVGTLKIFEGQEPADAIYSFTQGHNLGDHVWRYLIKLICEDKKDDNSLLVCNRKSPIVFTVPISHPNGTYVGHIHLQADDEPIDPISKFTNKHGLSNDERQSILEGVCRASGFICTRRKPKIYSVPVTVIKHINASDNITNLREEKETLTLLEDDEPTDVIYDFAIANNMTIRERKSLLINICSIGRNTNVTHPNKTISNLFNCTRAEPRLFSLPVMEKQDEELGKCEVFEGQEPVDAVYAFIQKHDLFQKAPVNTSLIEIVCNSTRVNCTRRTPRRELFTMHANWYGIPHVIRYVKPEKDWICEDEEEFGGRDCIHYIEIYTKEFCDFNMPDWGDCFDQVSKALRSQLDIYEDRVWDGKDLYAKLGLVRTATDEEIAAAYHTLVLRYNNETEPKKYEKLQSAYHTLSDPIEKKFYDMPCVKYFGCLCGKTRPDGSISITPDN